MASTITIESAVDESFDRGTLREHLDGLTDDDVSVSSPLSAGAPEVGVDYNQPERALTLRVGGHGGDFTKTSERALLSLLRDVEGVHDPTVTDGGYEAE